MECEHCNKTFSSKSSLNYHKNSAKYCLEIQNKNLKLYTHADTVRRNLQ